MRRFNGEKTGKDPLAKGRERALYDRDGPPGRDLTGTIAQASG
jgi:hypothetical protein